MTINAQIMKNYVGFNFYCSSDQFISIVIGQILHVPAQWSIYVRERSSRMYSPSAYFYATWMATTLNYLVFQPFNSRRVEPHNTFSRWGFEDFAL